MSLQGHLGLGYCKSDTMTGWDLEANVSSLFLGKIHSLLRKLSKHLQSLQSTKGKK